MSTLTQVEQNTPTPPSANQQLNYPKVGGSYRMAADGIEKKLIDTTSQQNTAPVIDSCFNYINFGGY